MHPFVWGEVSVLLLLYLAGRLHEGNDAPLVPALDVIAARKDGVDLARNEGGGSGLGAFRI